MFPPRTRSTRVGVRVCCGYSQLHIHQTFATIIPRSSSCAFAYLHMLSRRCPARLWVNYPALTARGGLGTYGSRPQILDCPRGFTRQMVFKVDGVRVAVVT